MALDHAALLEVLDTLKAGDAGERIRVAAETMYQALIDTELTARIAAQPWERSETRTNQRNGSRPRTLSTNAGDLQLRIPKLRTTSSGSGVSQEMDAAAFHQAAVAAPPYGPSPHVMITGIVQRAGTAGASLPHVRG
jgi:Transposase, Mutator family